ncbi:MAG: hypothetical protein ACREEW_17415 [Caulobacteraceae bacterium]
MAESRNNHYVPRWYQEGFFEPGSHELACLDLAPPRHELPDGSVVVEKGRFRRPTSRYFVERDLYTTFFATDVNVEIERFLFGKIDRSGAQAIRAFIGTDADEWIRHFQTLFEFLDIQKLRTPKGLDWLRTQYPMLTQNELMREMQGLRMMHCTIWGEGVREIVSAEDSEVKFIVTDHPVTVYNRAIPPGAPSCAYPHDPSIALKGSQTLFPLSRDFCLILTNLEYARDPAVNPLEKRTFARNYGHSIVQAHRFLRTRRLSDEQVGHINLVAKARARRFLAAGQQAWLSPDPVTMATWATVAPTLLPPADELWHFGGEILVRYEDGRVHFQDEFGRREPEHQKMFTVDMRSRKRGEACGCGSQRRFRDCCEAIPIHLRPSWTEMSVRERNLALFRAVVAIFEIAPDRSWEEIRRGITDDKIRHFYQVYASLWPIETDLLDLLPKPDGRPRAVYTGVLHPEAITDFALSAGLYFGQLLIENPLPHPRTLRPEYSPIDNPQTYRSEVLKAITFLLDIMPLVEIGLVNLVPDPCNFNDHLREQMMLMARERNEGRTIKPPPNDRGRRVLEADGRRSIMMLASDDALMRVAREAADELGEPQPSLEDIRAGWEEMKRRDRLAVLQPEPLTAGEAGGQMTMTRLAPNFEMAMYLAQATGAVIVTDSAQRWRELVEALVRRGTRPNFGLPEAATAISQTRFSFPQDPRDISELALEGALNAYPALFCDITTYLRRLPSRGRRPNFESHLLARLGRAPSAQTRIAKLSMQTRMGRISALLPEAGIRDNTVNRLLLMSSSEHHWDSVPAAYFIEPSVNDASC